MTELPLAAVETALAVPGWAWAAFLGFVGLMLALDLGVFKRGEREPSFREAVAWCVVWISLAVAFSFLLSAWQGPEDGELFAAGYVLELALSVDNLFLFILIFAHFGIADRLQHRVLFWGIIGAVAMRAVFIVGGIAAKEEKGGKGVGENFIVRLVRRFLPITDRLHGESFWAVEGGRRVFTRLFLVLLVIEGTDLLFAVDSVPAVLGILPSDMPIEERRFVAFTSNIFAIMGLRSMYFAISGFMHFFRFLKPALAFILVFIGVKMALPWLVSGGHADWVPSALLHDGKVHVPTAASLAVIGFILAVAVALSVIFPKRK